MPAFDALAVALLALAIDAAIGDPPWLYRAVPHPVAVVGRWIETLERAFNDPRLEVAARFRRGALVAACVTSACACAGLLAMRAVQALPASGVIEALLASTLLAFRGLRDHARAVADALDSGLEEGRVAVGHIVGRDVERLDAGGVSRAAIESAAENFSDGVVAPLFWYALLGLPGLCAYKAINTLDSMIGHLDPRHAAFGRVAARVDDAANWIPARLSALLIAGAAAVTPGADGAAALRAAARDAGRHRSVNAGWPEAAMAGALGIAIAGPRHYADRIVDDAWMGDGRSALCADDVRRAVHLYVASAALCAAVLAAGASLAWAVGSPID